MSVDETELQEELEDFGTPEELDETSAEFVDQLVKRIIIFTEEFCDVEFFPYQIPIAYRIIESTILGDGDLMTVVATRQSGKSEVLSAVIAGMMVILPKLAPIYPTWLGKFEKGFWVGTFAPTEEQADTVFGRIVSKLTSDHALQFLLDPEIDDKATGGGTRGRGRLITLKHSGSLCRMQTCNPKAKIESKTYHLVLVDEAQEADEVMITKSIAPMLAFNNGSMVLTGTANRYKSYFYKMIQYNKRRSANGGRKFRESHFEYDWRTAAKFNPNYAKFIAKEKLRIGEDSDEFQMSYCVSPETRILTADLRHIPAKDVVVGMKLVGFDEERPHKGSHRQFKESEVLSAATITRPSYRLTLTDGTSVVCSAEHQWLVLTAGRRTEWKTTESLVPTDQIMRITHMWDTVETYSGGYLSGAFDGEGHLAHTRSKQIVGLTFAQKDNPMLDLVRQYMSENGYEYTEYMYESNNNVSHMHLRGGKQAVMKFLGSIRPQRLLKNFSVNNLGSIGRHDKKNETFTHPFVSSLEFMGDQEVVAIKTTTSTYVAEGLASHNCNKFILEKGMFVTEERLDRMYDPSMPLVKEWWRTPCVAGIDVARANDSTVVTVCWVDWDHPDPFGFYEHRVLNWLEINNEEWENQYFEIVDFLRRYDLLRVGVDAQGVGGAVAERLQLLMSNIEVLPVSSDSKAQNERWVHLTELIQRDQLIIPGHSKARRTRTWKRFNQQMSDLEKVYKGPYLLAAAPNEKGAFDDYPDSLAIACSMTFLDTMPQVQESLSPFHR